MIHLGIDPGANGGLAALRDNGSVYALTRMPDTNSELLAWLVMFRQLRVKVLLEEVSGYIGEAHPGSRMFEFGRGYGALEMALTAVFGEWETVRPQDWMKGLGLRKRMKDEEDTAWKNYLKDEAASKFPRIAVTKATADALLIATYSLQRNEL